ncbi:GNAT family N-acetyltransferase [Aquimarina sp. AD1]|uniref:GNAT family N-acetyltransferase n=1 Tax=Aquimarina TaxID=290174 RepID=UPI000419F496|nr:MULTISPECIES: GNAT family N-acetyltransferase [Aquimarina]AXT54888.1 GNAT family N-acetyltransferase [Aquimarina sp. AD1]RKN21538.1 GNAT family N-acetyltransferase [Aquimarina sp. AD1]
MITIKEITSKADLTTFVKFPFELYKDSPYYVPSIIKEELDVMNPAKNPVFKNAVAKYFLAYKNNKIVGRIAAIINWIEVKEQQKPKIRFGWFDVIDDLEVTKALLEKVVDFGKQNYLEYMEGPVGFSNMDKAGILIKGFEELNTMITWYNYPYYQKHMEQLGFEDAATWVEYKIKVPTETKDKVIKFAKIIKERYQLQLLKFKKSKELLKYADDMFDLLNKTYSSLQTFVPIQQYQIEMYKKKYLPYLNPEYITCIADKNGKLIAFSIVMPSFSKALKKMNGKIYPLKFLHILKAQRRNDTAAFYLIGVDPEYQNKGVTALIFKEMNETFIRNGIEMVETNPELEENKAIQALWNDYEHEQHKMRRTYRKNL